MNHIDVFNGDADGICALHQLRLAAPCDHAQLVTGPKRDIRLLQRVEAKAGDAVTVLDISLDSNRPELERILANGATVRYFDHHFAGEEPFSHPGFSGCIDTASDVCTSLLVDHWLNGQHRLWAVVAAFGDNLHLSAYRAAEGRGLSDKELTDLQMLGECLNYNGYGEQLKDLWFHPAELYLSLKSHADPRSYLAGSSAFAKLKDGYAADLREAGKLHPLLDTASAAAFALPDAAWARRVSGILANHLAQARPDRAHAVLTPGADNCYTVSVRAPLERPVGADALCRHFPGGGGRAAAAGINKLDEADKMQFLTQFQQHFA